MKQSGRVHWLTVAGVASFFIIAGLIFFAPPSPSTAAVNFMDALAKGNTQTLTDLTLLSGAKKETLEKDWEFSVKHAAEHYRFKYRVAEAKEFANNTATVKVKVNRNVGDGGFDYEENYELPMEKEDGKWKVHVQAVSREMFPFLPR